MSVPSPLHLHKWLRVNLLEAREQSRALALRTAVLGISSMTSPRAFSEMQNPMPNTDLPICPHKIPGNPYTYAEDGSRAEAPRTNVSELPGALTPRCLLQ